MLKSKHPKFCSIMKEFTQMHIGQFKEFPLQSENKSKGGIHFKCSMI